MFLQHADFNNQIDQNIEIIKQRITDLLKPFYQNLNVNFNKKIKMANKISSPKLLTSKLLLTLNKIINNTDIAYINYEQLIDYCIVIELINIATKIHNKIQHNAQNDQVNISNMRFFHTQITMTQAILLGDAIYTLAFEQMVAINKQEILEHFVRVTKDMAFFEARLSEYLLSESNLESDQDLSNIINLVEQKFWPLYSSIIFILDKISVNNSDKPAKINFYIQNINTINSLNKILNKKINFSPSINNFIYHSLASPALPAPIELLKNNLNTVIAATKKIAAEINSDLFSKLNNLIAASTD